MKLVVATDVTVPGGVDVYTLALIDAMARAGHEVVLLFEQDTASPLSGQAAGRGVRTVPLPLYRGWYDRGVIDSGCRAFLAAARPDGVHVVTGSPRSCLALRTVAIELGIPLVVTESQVDETITLSEAERAQIRASYEAAVAVVFVAQGNLDTMSRATGIAVANALVVPNGVDMARLDGHRKASSRPPVPSRLVTVARLSPEKSLATLIDAMALLPRDLVSGLDVYGDGAMRAELADLITERGLHGRVNLLGWVPDIVLELKRYDLFVLPSTAEGMPYALLEAMGVGLPVVTTDVPGNVEALGDGAFGRLVARSDAKSLAEGITESVLKAEETEDMALAAIDRVGSHHDRGAGMARVVKVWS